jgi:hypothetical protein
VLGVARRSRRLLRTVVDAVDELHSNNGSVGLVLTPDHASAARGSIYVVRVIPFDREYLPEVNTSLDDYANTSSTDVERPPVVFRSSRSQNQACGDLVSRPTGTTSLRKDSDGIGGLR